MALLLVNWLKVCMHNHGKETIGLSAIKEIQKN